MKDRRCKGRVGTPFAEDFDKVSCCSSASGSNHRNIDCTHHRPREFAIKAVAHSISIDRCEQYFSRAALFRLSGPGYRIATSDMPASRCFHSKGPSVAVADAQSINGDNHRLRAITVRNSAD